MGGEISDDRDVDTRRALARFFVTRSVDFLPDRAQVARLDARDSCYGVAIAVELALKAFLLCRGWTDDRCRRELRHDLVKALAIGRAEGLSGCLRGLTEVVAVLNAYYPRHDFDRFSVPAGEIQFPIRAREEVADLIAIVRVHVEDCPG
jgi:hypothetical protein